jgi:multidrug efflux pump
MSLADLSIRRPVFAWMLMLALMLFGAISFSRLGVSQFPDFDFPVVNIRVSLEGASPEIMESEIIDVVENSVLGIAGLKDISSTARYGSANITLEFGLDQDIDVAIQEVQTKMSQVVNQLPEDTDPPVVSKNNPEDQPILWVGISGDMPSRELMTYVKDKLIPTFQLVSGVGEVFLGGYLEPAIRIWVDLKKLENVELTVDDLIATLDREHVEYPAGTLEKGEKEFTLRVIGEARSPEEIGNLLITRRGGGVNFKTLRIKDVARVEVGTEDVRRFSRVMGKPAVGIGIRKQRNTNAVAVALGVRNKVLEVEKSLPKNLNIGINFDSTKFIEEAAHELNFELILAALLTGLVCFLFFGSLGSTINILLAIPTSILGTFMAVKFFGFTLNTFTLLALILSVGIVVDDAIMVLENIMRHRSMGKTRMQAALEGANQITFTAVAATLSIIAIFLPVAFMEGVTGKFFFQFGVTLSIAVALSLLEALTLTPMRASEMIEASEKHGILEPYIEKLRRFYGRTLRICFNHKWKVVFVTLAIFFGSFVFVGLLKKEFVPAQDQGLFMVRLQTVVGSSLEYTDALVKQAEAAVSKVPGVNRYFVSVGGMGGGHGGSSVNTAMMFVTLLEPGKRQMSQAQIMVKVREVLKPITGLRAVIQDLSGRGLTSSRGFPIEFSVRGPDWDTLVKLSEQMQEDLKKDPRFVDIDSNYEEGMPEVKIYPDRERAAALGVSVNDIGKVISYLIGGSRIGRFTENGRRIDVRLRVDEMYRMQPSDIMNLSVRNNRGELIPLRDVARIEERKTLVSITREQRERAIRVFSNVAPGASQAAMLSTVQEVAKKLPDGYRMVFSGSSLAFNESSKSMIWALLMGIAIAYMILASQYNSFIHPVTVLLALPFSLTGAWLFLWLGVASLNLYSMIGLLLLMGLVKKNSIMLVDFANQLRREGTPTDEAMIKAGPIRLRPILMTSLTMITASLPSVLGLGPGSETRVPMSLAVIGGILVSTIFTLYVVPVAYSLFSRLERKRQKI